MCFAFALQETNIFPNPQRCALCSSLFSSASLFLFPSLPPPLPFSFSCFLHIYSFFHLHIFNFNSESKRQMKLVWFSLPPLLHQACPLSSLSNQAPPQFSRSPLYAFLHMPLLPSLSSALTMVFRSGALCDPQTTPPYLLPRLCLPRPMPHHLCITCT